MTFTSAVKPELCPNCGHLLDAVSDMRGQHVPSPGDFSICAYCTSALRWTDTMALRKTTLDELRDIPPELAKYILALKVACACRPPPDKKSGRC